MDETELVRGLRAGTEGALREIWRRHYGDVHRHILGKEARSPADAADIAQETFLRAYRSGPKFEGRSGIRTWLFTLSHHAALDFYKVRATRYEAGEVEDVLFCREREVGFEVAEDGAWEPLDALLQKESRDQTWRRIAQLSDEQRAVLTYRLIDRLSTAETAKLMNKNEGAVKMLLCRATKALLGAASARPVPKTRGEAMNRGA